MWQVYEQMASFYERHAADSAYNAYYDRPAVLELAGNVDGLDVLDAGCGPGLYAEELLLRGANVTAVDASTEQVTRARARLGDKARVQHVDLESPLPFDDGQFDLVVCALVIHYVEDRHAAFAEFRRVLRPGGRAVVSTQHPTIDWLRKGGSYFAVQVEEDLWDSEGGRTLVKFWREPLTALCAAATDSGFLIEQLVEPRPTPAMKERWPEDWERLNREPGFIILKLLKPS
jgi:SAM-dependent methyltransferase